MKSIFRINKKGGHPYSITHLKGSHSK